MSKYLKRVLWILPILTLGVTSLAYSHFSREGRRDKFHLFRWWERPKIVQQLKLTDQQVSQIKEIYFEEAKKSIDLRAELEKEHLELEKLLEQDALDEEKISKQVDTVEATRSALSKNHVLTHVKIYKALSSDQRAQLKKMRMEMREQSMERSPERGPRRSEEPRP
jgi:Spy/CpxP family protein refolding chaperone